MITTVDKVKTYLTIAGTSSDAMLAELVAAADAFVLSYTGRKTVLEADFVERYNGTGSDRLMLDNYPIASVASLVVNDRTIGPSAGYGQQGYFFDNRALVLYNERFTKGFRNVQVSYRAGFAEIPADMEQAATYIVSQMYKRKDRIGVSSKTIGQESISYNANDLDATSKTILNEYKTRWLSR